MSAQPLLSADDMIADDYRVIRLLGMGGMGAVYVAEQLSTGVLRAVKTMHRHFVDDAVLRRRFEQEARVSARIESEFVVHVLGAGVDAKLGLPWIAMELLVGEPLAAHLADSGPLDVEAAIEILRPLCEALGAAHRVGVVHRDLKPENIFLARPRRAGDRFTLKVLDFGIAKLVADAGTHATGTLGTPQWMAPEQTVVGAAVTPAADVWSLGLIAFTLFTGRRYWRSANAAETTLPALIREVVLDPIVPASERARDLGVEVALPASFDAWFARCVNREGAARFADADEAFVALEKALDLPSAGAAREPVHVAPPPDAFVVAEPTQAIPDSVLDSDPPPNTSPTQNVRNFYAKHLPSAVRASAEPAETGDAIPEAWDDSDDGPPNSSPTENVRKFYAKHLPATTDDASEERASADASEPARAAPDARDGARPPKPGGARKPTPDPPDEARAQPPAAASAAAAGSDAPDGSRGRWMLLLFGVLIAAVIGGLALFLGTRVGRQATGAASSGSVGAPKGSVARTGATSDLDRADAEGAARPMVSYADAAFSIGSNDGEANERPPTAVTVESSLLDRDPVTAASYLRCVEAGACSSRKEGPHCNLEASHTAHPANCVTAKQAETYCHWLGRRLPTEIEWEWAAAGEAGRPHPWGVSPPDATRLCWDRCSEGSGTCEVGLFPAGNTPEGLRDLAGNVWEWTSSNACPYTNPSCGDPRRITRGGGWCSPEAKLVRTRTREPRDPEDGTSTIGFRCARTM